MMCSTYFFKALPLRRSISLLTRVAAAFGQEPVAIAGMAAQHDAGGGDVKDGDAAAYHQMLGRKVGDHRRAADRLARRRWDAYGGQFVDYVRHRQGSGDDMVILFLVARAGSRECGWKNAGKCRGESGCGPGTLVTQLATAACDGSYRPSMCWQAPGALSDCYDGCLAL